MRYYIELNYDEVHHQCTDKKSVETVDFLDIVSFCRCQFLMNRMTPHLRQVPKCPNISDKNQDNLRMLLFCETAIMIKCYLGLKFEWDTFIL